MGGLSDAIGSFEHTSRMILWWLRHTSLTKQCLFFQFPDVPQDRGGSRYSTLFGPVVRRMRDRRVGVRRLGADLLLLWRTLMGSQTAETGHRRRWLMSAVWVGGTPTVCFRVASSSIRQRPVATQGTLTNPEAKGKLQTVFKICESSFLNSQGVVCHQNRGVFFCERVP